MTKVSQALGRWGEKVAADHLVANGMVLLDRNWQGRSGEVDIIARDGDTLVFCEVKTRRGMAFGDPAETIVGVKSRRLRGLAGEWLAMSAIRPPEVRFDVVKVIVTGTGGPTVSHVRGAF